MAAFSIYLFYIAAALLTVGFITHVVHTTVLAVGRGAAVALVPRHRLAGAGVGSGSSSVVINGGHGGQRGLSRTRAGGGTVGGLESGSASAPTVPGSIAIAFTWIGWLALAGSLLVRAVIVGRGPWGNMYEFSIAFAFGILGGYLFLGRRYPIRTLGFLPVGVALFLIGYAMTLPATIEPLVPALQSPGILTVHVAMAVISYGIFATSFAAAVGYLIQGPRDRVAWLPSSRVLDEVAYRAVIIGFPVFATLIILGSWWASVAWGRYWGWDPKETSSLVTWLIYAVYLHARNQRGWAGRPAALILVLGFVGVLFTYFGNLFFSGLHSYSGL